MKKRIDEFFKISESGSTVKREILAGLITFAAMAYILVANPAQIAGIISGDELEGIWNAVYIASILAAFAGTMVYAFFARLPYAAACGMGLSSLFFTAFVLPARDAAEGYAQGLLVVLFAGILFFVLSITGARKFILSAIPDCLKRAIPAGIGLLVALMGLQLAGIIVPNAATFASLFDFNAAISAKGVRDAFDAWCAVAPVVLALVGILLIAFLEKKRVKCSVAITLGAITLLYYGTTLTLPEFDFLLIGDAFVDFGSTGVLGAIQGFTIFEDGLEGVLKVVVLALTFCLVGMFDTVGVLYGTAAEINSFDQNGDPRTMKKAMISDSIATSAGALLGAPACSVRPESTVGIAAGGRTGLTSLVTAICFALCLALTPLASIIPACAVAPALVYVGVLMLKNFARIDMSDITHAVPAFLTLITIPLTYSISSGIALGALSYVILAAVSGKFKVKDFLLAGIALLFVLKFIFVGV